MKRSMVTLVAGVLALAVPVPATIINVPGDQPTIQAGIDASVDGDTVLVADGTYTGDGNRDIDFLGKAIVVRSLNGPELTIIDCERNGYHVQGFIFHSGEDSTSVLSGFTIKNGRAQVGGGISCGNSSPTIEYNIITENSAAWGYGGGIALTYSNATITNNTISGNTALLGGGGLLCFFDSFPVITNTIFWGNSAPSNPEILPDDPSTLVITYSDIQGGWEGEGNIDCDPMFCDPENGNFYLDAASCCVGAGEGGVDIGALWIGCGQEIPTLSEWGAIILSLLLLATGTIAVIRRRKEAFANEH